MKSEIVSTGETVAIGTFDTSPRRAMFNARGAKYLDMQDDSIIVAPCRPGAVYSVPPDKGTADATFNCPF